MPRKSLVRQCTMHPSPTPATRVLMHHLTSCMQFSASVCLSVRSRLWCSLFVFLDFFFSSDIAGGYMEPMEDLNSVAAHLVRHLRNREQLTCAHTNTHTHTQTHKHAHSHTNTHTNTNMCVSAIGCAAGCVCCVCSCWIGGAHSVCETNHDRDGSV